MTSRRRRPPPPRPPRTGGGNIRAASARPRPRAGRAVPLLVIERIVFQRARDLQVARIIALHAPHVSDGHPCAQPRILAEALPDPPQRGSRARLMTGERYSSPLWPYFSPAGVTVTRMPSRLGRSLPATVGHRLAMARASSAMAADASWTSCGSHVAAIAIGAGNIVVGRVQTTPCRL